MAVLVADRTDVAVVSALLESRIPWSHFLVVIGMGAFAVVLAMVWWLGVGFVCFAASKGVWSTTPNGPFAGAKSCASVHVVCMWSCGDRLCPNNTGRCSFNCWCSGNGGRGCFGDPLCGPSFLSLHPRWCAMCAESCGFLFRSFGCGSQSYVRVTFKPHF